MTLEELLQRLGDGFDHATLEEYIARAWIRPAGNRFENIDLVRVQLVRHLQQDMQVSDDAMDIVLHLLDQLYGVHERMRQLKRAIARQPRSVQTELWAMLTEDADDEYSDA